MHAFLAHTHARMLANTHTHAHSETGRADIIVPVLHAETECGK